MMDIRCLAGQRKSGSNCKVALIEVKYGNDALGGCAYLLKHLKDMENLISAKDRYSRLLQTMESQFNQLDDNLSPGFLFLWKRGSDLNYQLCSSR